MGRRIVITSGKGGVGKTTVTASIGIALSQMNKKVVLVDGDIGLNNLDVVLSVENKIVYDILDVCLGRCRLKQALIQDISNPNLYVLPSTKVKDNPKLNVGSFRNIIDTLSLNFDYVIIDCPAGIDNGFHRAVSAANEAFVVTTPSVSAVRDANKVLSILTNYDMFSVQLIINRLRRDLIERGEMMSAEDIVRVLRTKPVGIIPDDDYIAMLQNSMRLPFDTVSGRAFKMLASNIVDNRNAMYDIHYKESFIEKIKRFCKL